MPPILAEPLDVRVSEPRPGTRLIRCSGAVCLDTAPLLGGALDSVARAGVREVALDLRAVTALDSVGVEQILSAAKRLRAAGGGLRVHASDPRIRLLLQMAGLPDLLAPDEV